MNPGPGARWVRLLLFVVLLSVPALADDMIIDFFGPGNLAPSGATTAQRAAYNGTVTYIGGTAPLVGSQLNISGVAGVNTPANSGSMFEVTGTQPMTGMGTLNFITGNYVGMLGGYRQFAGGGVFEIWGAVPDLGLSYRRLLWGSVLGALVNDAGYMKLAVVDGTDKKDAALVSAFGFDPATVKFEFSGTIHAARVGLQAANGGFLAIASGSTNISNAVVPEPGSMALLGSAIVLISLKLRKKILNSQSV